MKISQMTPQTSLNNSDTFPFIRGTNNFSATIKTITDHVLSKFTSILGNVLSYLDATNSTKILVADGSEVRHMTLAGLMHYFHSNFFLTHVDMDNVAIESGVRAENVLRGFNTEFPQTPKIMLTVRSSGDAIYKINVGEINPTMFRFSVKKFNPSDNTWDFSTDALSVQYVAIYRAWG